MPDFKKDPAKPISGSPSTPDHDLGLDPAADEFFKRFQADARRPQPNRDAIAAAMQAMQRLAAESAGDVVLDRPDDAAPPAMTRACSNCGHQSRPGSRFCGLCGLPLEVKAADPAPEPQATQSNSETPAGPHHYHHHYHHHYFSSSPDFQTSAGRPAATGDSPVRDVARLRNPSTPQVMSRAETAVRKVTQDWVVACNSKQLDDLVSTYATDAIVMRSNHPPVRGTPAIREFFFSALDAGLGEVELDVLRVDVVGEMAYEAGRCKMLVPTAMGKRREDRGKYLMILSKQSDAEWRIVADCWSSDLTLSAAEPDSPKPPAPPLAAAKPAIPRKIT
jgi:ketosteroid isomerase-like protein